MFKILLQQNNLQIDSPINITPISIPIFNTPYLAFNQFSLISWISTLGILLMIFLSIYWVFTIIKITFNAVKASDNQEEIKKLFQKLRRLFISISIFFLFPVFLSIIGIIAGFGHVFQWPEMFSFCQVSEQNNQIISSTENNRIFFYQVLLQTKVSSEQDLYQQARQVCFGSN